MTNEIQNLMNQYGLLDLYQQADKSMQVEMVDTFKLIAGNK